MLADRVLTRLGWIARWDAAVAATDRDGRGERQNLCALGGATREIGDRGRIVIGVDVAPGQPDFAGRAGWGTFGGYMRGQFLIALFHGVTTTILLEILRVPLAPALGVLIFIGSFIPLLGLLVTGALAVAIAILEHGLTAGIVVAVAIIVLVQVASDSPYDTTSGHPSFASTSRCNASVIGADPQRAMRSDASAAGSNDCDSIREYIVGTPVMIVGRTSPRRSATRRKRRSYAA